MGVPKEILKVKRPPNTAVFDSGSNGPLRYSVHPHNGWKHPEGKKPYPTFGGVIGHITNGLYVPVQSQTETSIPSYASYAVPTLIKSVSGDILEDLFKVYPVNEAYTLFNTAAVRVIRPRCTSRRINKTYESTFLQVYYPGAALSKNTICTLLRNVGQNFDKLAQFYGLRLERALGDHLAIDGMLRTDDSVINSLSAYSRKAKIKNTKDLSLMYAFSTEKTEPVCVEPFPGNRPDTSAYVDFIRLNDIRDATIIDDTGFAVNSIRKELDNRPDLHYLTSIKRNDSRIKNNDMLKFDHPLKDSVDPVIGHKQKIQNGTYLYSFRDAFLSARELTGYVTNAQKKGKDVDPLEYTAKNDISGVLVLESDLDASLEVIYMMHASRWLIEMAFKRYKHDLDIEQTNVQDDYSVQGTELVNYISTVITCRILKKAAEAHVLDEMTYGEMMDSLRQAWRRTSVGAELPTSHDNNWLNPTNQDYKIMEALGICQPEPKVHRKRGRPKKTPVAEASAASSGTSSKEPDTTGKSEAKPATEKASEIAASNAPAEGEISQPEAGSASKVSVTEKKKRGRPRKNPPVDPDKPKRGPGRPRKYPPKDPNAPKRKPGRPRKVPEEAGSNSSSETPKRGPGRPRKYPPKDPNAPKRGPGRPRKNPPVDPDAPKRGPGRPRKYPPKDPNAPKRKAGRPRKRPIEEQNTSPSASES